MKRLWVALLAAAIACELVVVFMLPAATPGHVQWRDYVSTAGVPGQPYAGWVATLGIIGALLHLAWAAIAMRVSHGAQRATFALLGAFLLLVGAGFLVPCDPGCALETPTAQAHHVLGTLGFTSLGLAALVQVGFVRPWGVVAAWAVAVGLADLALLASDLTGAYHGLTERLAIVTMQGWSVALTIRLAPRLQGQSLLPGRAG